jgi:g-D-glutamyl-meso-diaminopimelate peptidase
VFISGAWHANEYITAEFLMRFLEEACRNSNNPEWKALLSKVTLYISPMINPDGCEIVAHYNDLSPVLTTAVKAISPPGYDINQWRANIQGVDLNSQFPVRWEVSQKNLKKNTLPEGNAGEKPLTSPEAKAVYDFTLSHNFSAVFCYHSQGQVMYWRTLDGKETPLMSYLTEAYAKESGYSPSNTTDLSGGYRDWFVSTFKKPGITIELGSGVNPLPLEQFASIWDKNYNALCSSLQILAN